MIENVVVEQAHRNTGVGALLFAEAQRWAAQKGLKFIQATVYVKNSESTRFFKKHGFAALSERLELDVDKEAT